MKKSALILFFVAFVTLTTIAQSIQDGVNNFYAERYQSAKGVFEKLAAANPNNLEANYWLGQVYLAQNNVQGAKDLYQRVATTSNNAPLISVGQGHVALLEGKAAEARQQFEAAINASKGKKGNDPNILNAVGRANVEAYTEATKYGDLNYAVTRLTEASQLAPNNPDVFLNLGNAYRKKRDAGSGGLAIQNYIKAKQINPGFAVASYRSAMLYKTQVNYRQPDAWGVVIENLNSAVASDPKFAPAYEQLYYYALLAQKDFPAAESWAAKYISSSDPSVENDYLKAQTEFVQNKFNEAIGTAKNIIGQTNNQAKARVYRLLGYSYMGIKDTTTACDYVNQFFTRASEDDVVSQDYILHAQSCGKNNPDLIRADIMKAVTMDSVLSRQLATLNAAIDEAKKSGQRLLEGELGLMRYQLLGEKASTAQLVNLGIPFYYGSQFQKADSLFQAYNKAYPDSIYGYLWSTKALIQLDTAMTTGLAVPAYDQLLRVAEMDKTRDLYKNQGVQAAGYLAAYYTNTKSDKATALTYVDRGLAFDPNNAYLLNVKKVLSTAPRQTAPATKPAPKTGGTAPSGSRAR